MPWAWTSPIKTRALCPFDYLTSPLECTMGIAGLNMFNSECLFFPSFPAVSPKTLLLVPQAKKKKPRGYPSFLSFLDIPHPICMRIFKIHAEPDRSSPFSLPPHGPSLGQHGCGPRSALLTLLPASPSPLPTAASRSSSQMVISDGSQRVSVVLLSVPVHREQGPKAFM